MSQIASLLFNPEVVIIALSAIASFVAILAFGAQFIRSDEVSKRMKSVAERRQELSKARRDALAAKGGQKKQMPKARVDFMRAVLEKVRLQNLIASKEMRIKLAQAGKRGQAAAVAFGFARFAVPLIMVVGGILFFSAAKDLQLSFFMKALILAGLAAIGFYLPNVLVTNMVQKRQQVLNRSFPDALDLLTICVEAGLSIEAAFARVADEMSADSPDLAEEFGLTTAELAFLGDRKVAFLNLAERTGLESTKSLATALIQSERYGTPVSTSLRVLAQDNRDQRMSFAEKKAGALPAQLTVPMIVFFLPVLFVVILGPAVIQVMNQ